VEKKENFGLSGRKFLLRQAGEKRQQNGALVKEERGGILAYLTRGDEAFAIQHNQNGGGERGFFS